MRPTLQILLRRLSPAIVFVSLILYVGCSTGIESTKKIRMTKEDTKLMEKSPEQKFSESIQGTPLSDWKQGKEFMAMSDRTMYIFEPAGMDASSTDIPMKGRILTYRGTDSHLNPDLKEECVIVFSDGDRLLRYRTGKPTATAMKETDSSKLPLISDMSLIEEWKQKTLGSTFWTKSNLWYDENGNRIKGLKFAKVRIKDVLPSTGDFPISVRITDENGLDGYLQMNYTSDLHDSRNFAAIFYLSDPKKKYPHISDEHWDLIKQGKVAEGMTKEECKLSIGNPDEVRSGHNRSQTMDIWQYANGTYLIFTDGLLNEYRQ